MNETHIFLIILAAFLAAAGVLGMINARRRQREIREKLRKAFGKPPLRKYAPEELTRIPRYFEKHTSEESRSAGGILCDSFIVDDITANDLDLWSLFARINYCQSAAGEEVLYHTLRSACLAEDELLHREDEISYFDAAEEKRLDLQMAFRNLGGSGKYSVYDYLDQLSDVPKKSILPHLLGDLALLLSVILIFISFTWGFLALILTAGYQIVTYYREKSLLDAYLSTFGYILRLLSCGDQTAKILTFSSDEEHPVSLDNRIKELEEKLSVLRQFQRGAGILLNASRTSGTGNPLDILMDYIRMLLHTDLIKFQQMIREAGAHTKDIDRIITILGGIEAMISVACFRVSVPAGTDGKNGWCRPSLYRQDNSSARLSLSVTDLRHVLLEEGAVTNSMSVSRGVLLTGSNASGKSTWLKSLGLAGLMAQTIHTVTATGYSAPMCRIYSSMALADNLQGGESYYIVEIRALSRVLEAASAKGEDGQPLPPVLCFIDEVLRGTNTIERIAASAQILAHFSHESVLLFAATHDLELTGLLGDIFDNYHFEGELTEEDVRFDFVLKEGPSRTRNAIGLLKRFAYDEEITGRAEDMARRFEKTGIWTMDDNHSGTGAAG